MYISDWLATLLHVARLDSLLPPNVDSLNMWPMIRQGRPSERLEIVLNLDQDPVAGTWSAAIRYIKFLTLFGLCVGGGLQDPDCCESHFLTLLVVKIEYC